MANTEYQIFFKIKEKVLYGTSIRASHDKVELFYHYPFGSNDPSEVENNETGGIDDGYLPDHISFHTNGNIHTKARDEDKKKIYINTINPGLNVFNLEGANYLPFFIESINISESRYIAKRFKEGSFDEKRDILFDVTNYNSFSILLVSKCEKLNPRFIMEDNHLKNLNYIAGDIITGIFTKEDKGKVLEVNSTFNTDLAIFLVENVWEKFQTTIHHINNDEGMEFSTTICMPPVELIGKMINLN